MAKTAKIPRSNGLRQIMAREWFLILSLFVCAAFLTFGEQLFAGLSNYFLLTVLFGVLFAVVIGCALGVVRHAEAISVRLGEPFGTLVLTLSITAIEVMSITAVMLHGDNNPTLVRDTLFSVVMIVMGGMVGLSLLLGAVRHREQAINLQGANAYLGVIVPLAVLSLVLPDFTSSTSGPTLSVVQKIMVGSIAGGLYLTFLLLQTGRHRAYFTEPDATEESHKHEDGPLALHLVLLVCYIVPVVLLVEQLAHPIDFVIETLGAPPMVGGVMLAILVATPEGIGGVKAALRNQLQTSVNVFLGSVLATIGLTVPIMLVLAQMLGLDLVLGLQSSNLVLLLLMLAVSVITFSSGRTNLMQGAVHLLLFAAFLILLFQG
ncbi:MAG: calcium:proton antiporter [Alphaproteobacteria bacterium]|nr:calcium:proton antiporter [Alphaproteobacteria bacterium]